MKKFIKKHDNQSDYQNLVENYKYVLDKWINLSKEVNKQGYDKIRTYGQICDLALGPLELAIRMINKGGKI